MRSRPPTETLAAVPRRSRVSSRRTYSDRHRPARRALASIAARTSRAGLGSRCRLRHLPCASMCRRSVCSARRLITSRCRSRIASASAMTSRSALVSSTAWTTSSASEIGVVRAGVVCRLHGHDDDPGHVAVVVAMLVLGDIKLAREPITRPGRLRLFLRANSRRQPGTLATHRAGAGRDRPTPGRAGEPTGGPRPWSALAAAPDRPAADRSPAHGAARSPSWWARRSTAATIRPSTAAGAAGSLLAGGRTSTATARERRRGIPTHTCGPAAKARCWRRCGRLISKRS
jgi:hypothetical protein